MPVGISAHRHLRRTGTSNGPVWGTSGERLDWEGVNEPGRPLGNAGFVHTF